MLVNERQIINILPHEVKSAYNFLVNKKSPNKDQEVALEAITYLLKLEPDTETLIATILFQVPHISDQDLKDMKNSFGNEVVSLVKDLLKFSRIPKSFDASEKRKTFIRKAMLVLTKDVRALYIKLATRLAKLKVKRIEDESTIEKMSQEIFDVHAPLADLLGLWDLRFQLEDNAFKYLYPEEYQKVLLYRSHKKSTNEEYIKKIENTIINMAKTLEISHTIEIRLKHLYEIYKKQTRKFNSNSLKDILAFQIITPSKKDCYRMLGIIHSIWKPRHKALKDYIAIPKMNGYQALHTTVFGPNERICLFQITTPDMIKQQRVSISKDKMMNKDAHTWLKSTLEHTFETDAQLLVKGLKNNSLEKSIFIFTKKGKIINLPKISTCIDAAYSISSNTGTHYLKARVNGLKVKPTHVLQTGDTVEIETSKESKISQLYWIEHSHTEKATKGIQKKLKLNSKKDQVRQGAKKFDKALKRIMNTDLKTNKTAIIKRIKEKTKFKNLNELFLSIGIGKTNIKKLLKKLYTEKELIRNSNESKSKKRTTKIVVYCKNEMGILSKMTDKIVELKLNLIKVSTRLDENDTTGIIDMLIEIDSFDQLYKIMERLCQIKGVTDVRKL